MPSLYIHEHEYKSHCAASGISMVDCYLPVKIVRITKPHLDPGTCLHHTVYGQLHLSSTAVKVIRCYHFESNSQPIKYTKGFKDPSILPSIMIDPKNVTG